MGFNIEIIRKLLPVIMYDRDGFTSLFFDNLFLIDPNLRSIITAEVRDELQSLFESAMQSTLTLFDDPDQLEATLERLGRDTTQAALRQGNNSVFAEALLMTLERIFGEAWNADVEEAWDEAVNFTFGIVLRSMSERVLDVSD